jgi:PqqD family protein of HPr-rel-A system
MSERAVEVWRALTPSFRHLRRWRGEAVLMNPSSWETHLLNPAATEVLTRLEAGPCSLADLADAWAGDDACDSEVDACVALADLLVALEAMGLVSRSEVGGP